MAPSTKLASSLYSGIFDDGDDGASKEATSSAISETKASTDAGEQPKGDEHEDQPKDAGPEATAPTPKSQVAWSAALRFAPRKSVAQQKKRPTVAAALLASSSSMESAHVESKSSEKSMVPVHVEAESSSSSSTSKPSAGPSKEVLQGIKTTALSLTDSAGAQKDFSMLPIITQPPEMAIPPNELERDRAIFAELAEKRGERKRPDFEDVDDEDDGDVNGWSNTKEGKRAKKKKHKRKRGASPGLQSTINMDADYDVRVPNDYSAFKDLMRSRREAIRRLRKEREMQEQWGSDEEDEEDEDLDLDEERRRKLSRFAPPASYSAHVLPSAAQGDAFDDDEKPYLSPPPAPPEAPPAPPAAHTLPQAQSGEEAYQRRLALSQAATGEDAYQRRLAMSQRQQQQQQQQQKQEQESASISPPAPAALEALPEADELKRKKEAAIAIAARLAKLRGEQTDASNNDPERPAPTTIAAPAQDIAPGPPPPGPPPRPPAPPVVPVRTHVDPSTFAERLLAKQGWKKGEALGSEGSKGILEPIRAEKLASSSSKKSSSSSRQEETHGHSKNLNNRGTVINSMAEEERRKAEAQYGPPSEVVVLENVVASIEDVDDDLPQEVGDECGKHGFVQRVLVHPSSPSAGESLQEEPVKVFVRFSGMAGAWRCLKELDGRYFGGRTVRARYYDCQAFDSGDYSRPLS